jgi:hypothetical protein
MAVDIGQNKDWSMSNFKEDQNKNINGKEYNDQIAKTILQ